MKGLFTDEGADRLQAALEFITNNPKKHKQGTWVDQMMDTANELGADKTWTCGTAACLAGWITLMNGYMPSIGKDDFSNYWDQEFPLSYAHVVKADDPKADSVDVSGQALRLLVGDEAYEANLDSWGDPIFDSDPWKVATMFRATNTINDLWKLAEDFSDGYVKRSVKK